MLRNTKPSDDDSHRECDKADGFGPIRYRILDTRSENFWATNFTSVASVGKSFVPASPAGAVACQCTCANDVRFHTFFATRVGAALNSQAYVDPTLRDGETADAGYKNLNRNAYMLFQSFTFDVDADAGGGGASDGTYLQVILRDDDDVDELEPFVATSSNLTVASFISRSFFEQVFDFFGLLCLDFILHCPFLCIQGVQHLLHLSADDFMHQCFF